MKKVDFILMSDLHLRETMPECRTDDFMKAQEEKYEFIKGLQRKCSCPCLVSGDIFHHWKPSPFLISFALRYLPSSLYAIPGQHDLPNHNHDMLFKSGFYSLVTAGKIKQLDYATPLLLNNANIYAFPFGHLQKTNRENSKEYNIAVIHHLVFKGKEPFPGAADVGGTAKSIIKKLKGFDLILSGDNHETFVEEYDGTVLINPGSLMRTTAKQADHKPCVFLYNLKDNEYEQVYLPIKKNAVSREHIEVKEERDERIDAFVSRLDDEIELDLSFKNNMTKYLAKNRVRPRTTNIIKECMS